MTEGRQFRKFNKQWSRRKARNLTDNWKQTTKRLAEPQTWIKRFKVESQSKFVGHLESHYTVQRRQVARLKQGSNWFKSSFKKLLESVRTEVHEWKDTKPVQVEDAGSEAWQLTYVVRRMINKSLHVAKMLIGKMFTVEWKNGYLKTGLLSSFVFIFHRDWREKKTKSV